MTRKSHASVAWWVVLALTGCGDPVPFPQWNNPSEVLEAEYAPFLVNGNSALAGQVSAPSQYGWKPNTEGLMVTLDPATSTGIDWYQRAGKSFTYGAHTPLSPNFHKARRTAVTDAEGRFTFSGLPPGKYYACTDITWTPKNYRTRQGERLSHLVEIAPGRTAEVTLAR